MPHGYNGKILHVDLTSGKFRVEEPGEAFYRKYLGGSALAMYYLLKELPSGVDPLSPENILVLALSVLTGAAISGQSRMDRGCQITADRSRLATLRVEASSLQNSSLPDSMPSSSRENPKSQYISGFKKGNTNSEMPLICGD